MGFNWSKFAELAKQLAPIVCVAAGLPPMLGQGIGIAIGEAQQIQGATNEQKKAHVMATVDASIAATNSVLAAHGKQTLPADDIMKTASAAIDTTVAAVRTVHDAHPAPQDTQKAGPTL